MPHRTPTCISRINVAFKSLWPPASHAEVAVQHVTYGTSVASESPCSAQPYYSFFGCPSWPVLCLLGTLDLASARDLRDQVMLPLSLRLLHSHTSPSLGIPLGLLLGTSDSASERDLRDQAMHSILGLYVNPYNFCPTLDLDSWPAARSTPNPLWFNSDLKPANFVSSLSASSFTFNLTHYGDLLVFISRFRYLFTVVFGSVIPHVLDFPRHSRRAFLKLNTPHPPSSSLRAGLAGRDDHTGTIVKSATRLLHYADIIGAYTMQQGLARSNIFREYCWIRPARSMLVQIYLNARDSCHEGTDVRTERDHASASRRMLGLRSFKIYVNTRDCPSIVNGRINRGIFTTSTSPFN
ncbi:hypothetical protein B0H11DRAFT_2236563 [Mycena galericulata]|nr:hypothetical protein B0H11DRAFT_2236563 [Mycena galericulata]